MSSAIEVGSDDGVAALVAGIRAGRRRAIARALTLAEEGDPRVAAILGGLRAAGGATARTIGITGPPGVGKSTLIAALARHLREQGETVAVVAVDPSSALTGGAVLGDRARMAEHALDRGVFIRSMSARGRLGGVADGTFLSLRLLGAAGFDVLLCETVGVGQSEVAVAALADVVVVILQPGAGDGLQLLKAGLMEIPQVVCLNKRDHPDADRLRRDLHDSGAPVVATNAETGEGVADLWAAIAALDADEGAGRQERLLVQELRALALASLTRSLDAALAAAPAAEQARTFAADPAAAVAALASSVRPPR